MTATSTTHPHTAITTWNGFVYQGKVAIYHVLQLLNDPDQQTDFVLQLDSLEDFAILDSSGVIKSIHQVKALKSQYYSSYKEAFENLKNKANRYSCDIAKFHIARVIHDKTENEIATDHSPIQIYKYGTDCFCPVDAIDTRIEDKIKSILATVHSSDISKQSIDYIRVARSYLDQIVLKKVMEIHRIVHEDKMSDGEAAYSQTIHSLEFMEILSCDLNQVDLGEDYFFYILLHDLHKYYQDYCIDNEEVLNVFELNRLSECMKEIGKLKKTKLIQFVRNIMPHREFKFKSLSDYKDHTFNKEEIQGAFLTILKTLKSPDFDPLLFFKWKVDWHNYSPTTIDKGPSKSQKICENIVKNALDTDLEVLFDGNCLITTDIDVPSVVQNLPTVIRSPESDDLEVNNITRWNTISLISLNNAKVEII